MKEGQPRVEMEKQKSQEDTASVTKMYRITTVPMARRAMEEVMRAVKAEDTKPLAFLGFANTYRDDSLSYIICQESSERVLQGQRVQVENDLTKWSRRPQGGTDSRNTYEHQG